MNKHLLTAPFARELVRERPGQHGKTLAYVEVSAYIQRLNEACDVWDFTVERYEVLDSEVVVLGRLVADGVVKSAFGGSSITIDRQGEVVSIADDLKAAASDALKKAASLLGVGLELYSGGRIEASGANQGRDYGHAPGRQGPDNGHARERVQGPEYGHARDRAQGAEYGHGREAGAREYGHARNTAKPEERATVRQLAAIHSAGRKRGLTKDTLTQFVTQHVGKTELSHLTRNEASAVISELSGNGAAS